MTVTMRSDLSVEGEYLRCALMDIDAECLREAKTENLERLALALGVSLPEHARGDFGYARRLVRAVLKGLAADRRAHRPQRRWTRTSTDVPRR